MDSPSRFCENCGTALVSGQRFCAGCGQPADGSSSMPQPMMTTPMAQVSAHPGWHAPGWMWLVVGLLFAGGVTAGLYYGFGMAPRKQVVLTQAQKDSIFQHVTDDIQKDPVDLEKAQHPTDLPPDMQKKFDGSVLSEGHNAQMREALSALPKLGADGELVDTKGAPTLQDDFSNTASGWRVGSDARATSEYADGKLQITFKADRGSSQAMIGKRAGNFAMQLEATPVSSPPNFSYGVVLRQSAAGRFVVFLIGPQGIYAISKREDGQTMAIVPPTPSPAIRKGLATNTIKVYAVDSHFVFEVNGSIVEVQEIAGFPAGDVGAIVVRSPNTDNAPTRVTFDNFKLWATR